MPDIVVSEFMNENALAPARLDHDVVFDPSLVDDRSRLLDLMGDAVAIIVRNRTQVDEELLAAAPRLRAVGRLGVGLDNIDLEACRRHSVVVHPALGANARAVAEYVIAAIFILLRGAYQARDRMRRGDWPRSELQGREVAGKRLALVGLGDIARRVAELAKALSMEVGAYDPYLGSDDAAWGMVARYDSLDDLLAEADAVSFHVPLTDSTRHMLDEATLRSMKRGAIVINTSRGGIIDEVALAEAIRSGHLGGAALDVFETEPLDEVAAEQFAGLDNVVLTPHIAGLTSESNERVSSVTVDNVLQTLSAQPKTEKL